MTSQLIKPGKDYFKRNSDIFRISLFIIFIFTVIFCNSSTGKKESGLFLYDLDNPDERYVLPIYLKEVSGLAYYKQNRIICVQDEKAEIYDLDLDKKEIVARYNFGKDGDYEDIAISDQTAYVIRSDGQIFEVDNFDKENRIVTEFKTPLSKKNDTEGLTFDIFSNSLFIACKGSPALKKENPYEGYKAIYQFDLGEKKLDIEPEFLIDLHRLDSYRDTSLFKEFSSGSAKKRYLTGSKANFQPSGLAIHPLYNEIYLIASQGKILIIMDSQGKVLDFQDLNTGIFYQPEGICFSPSGDLFIANEGVGGKGYILRFNLRNKK